MNVVGSKSFMRDLAVGAVITALILIVIAIWIKKSNPSDTGPISNTVGDTAPDREEMVAVNICGLRLQNSLMSESSYAPEPRWSYTLDGNTAKVVRRYEATNGFGAKLSSAYECHYDIAANRITFLEAIGPTGNTTLIDDRPNVNAKQHH